MTPEQAETMARGRRRPASARQEGRSLANEKRQESTLVPTDNARAEAVPGYAGTSLPQGSYFDNPERMEADAAATKLSNEQYRITTDADRTRPSFSNAEILEMWEKEHPGQRVTKSIKGVLANIKSTMKQKLGIGRKGKRGRKAAAVVEAVAAPARPPLAQLQRLEGAIDDCLIMARHLKNPTLDPIIEHLRLARNGAVYQQGER